MKKDRRPPLWESPTSPEFGNASSTTGIALPKRPPESSLTLLGMVNCKNRRSGGEDVVFPRGSLRKRKKPFSAWQIDLTTRCPLLCKMCIRSERNDWQSQDMPLQGFKKILSYLNEVETVEPRIDANSSSSPSFPATRKAKADRIYTIGNPRVKFPTDIPMSAMPMTQGPRVRSGDKAFSAGSHR